MKKWNDGFKKKKMEELFFISELPLFQYSIIPLFQTERV